MFIRSVIVLCAFLTLAPSLALAGQERTPYEVHNAYLYPGSKPYSGQINPDDKDVIAANIVGLVKAGKDSCLKSSDLSNRAKPFVLLGILNGQFGREKIAVYKAGNSKICEMVLRNTLDAQWMMGDSGYRLVR